MAHLGNTIVNGALRVIGDEYADRINVGSSVTTGALEVKGIIAGDSGSTGHGLYGGGGYHNAYNNILLHGDSSTATSGIAFMSDKVDSSGVVTNVNQPSDRAFIQYHACGITTATAEGTNPTLATSGENGRLVIGIGNDATDQVWLQTPSRTGLIHQVGNTSYVIPDTNNTTGSVGSATQPSYVEGGVIKACTYSLNKTVPSDAVFTDTNTTYTFATGDSNGQIKVTPSGGSAQNIAVKGLGSAAYTASTAYAAASHTHAINQVTWAGGQNLATSATANGQEWSIDMTPGSYTGTYFQVWSSKNSKTVLACYADNNKVAVPNGNLEVGGAASITGNLTVASVNGETVKYSSSVNAVVGDTTCIITDSSITTTSLIEPFSSNSTGDTIAIKNIEVAAGKAVLTFKALTVDTSFRLRITNV